MFQLLFLLAQVAVASVTAVSNCQTNHGGECHSSSTGCPLGFSHYTLNGCGFLSHCSYNAQTSSGHVSSTDSVTCGVPDYNDNHRIVGGTITDIRKYPWQVSVQYYGIHFCGGTLIDSQHVLTAAHCFHRTSNEVHVWKVAMGVNNVSHVSPSHLRSVEKIIVHHSYDEKTIANDIALIKLTKPVALSGPYVKTACLPESEEKVAGKTCTVTGWGKLMKSGLVKDGVHHLREAHIPVIHNALCQFYLGAQAPLTDNELCAGLKEGGRDACQGDSGGPLTCNDGGVWKVTGIVSWGYGCAERYSPGVYTRVSRYLQWIHSTINAS